MHDRPPRYRDEGFGCRRAVITPIRQGEKVATAEARLKAALKAVVVPLPRFVPGP